MLRQFRKVLRCNRDDRIVELVARRVQEKVMLARGVLLGLPHSDERAGTNLKKPAKILSTHSRTLFSPTIGVAARWAWSVLSSWLMTRSIRR